MPIPKHYLNIMVWAGLFFLSLFLYGFITIVDVGHPVLYTLLTISLSFKLIRILFEWYHYVNLEKISKTTLTDTGNWKVDVLTTACPGEPREMIEETLRAMVKISYPHQNYLCDEGNDPLLLKLCQDLGVHHVTRTTRENAKAGNINNALHQADGDICVILDPDHVPTPDFLDKTLPHFHNPEVGYVQVVQSYKNQDESLIACAAAEQTYNFYGPYMMAMGLYNTAQAIGANCTFRRKALDSIGGHAAGLTEDMHTSMLLHAKGWKSVYVPEVVSRGLVPSSLSAYYKQQLKWSRGTFDLWFNVFPGLVGQLSWRQILHYGLLPLYYLFGFITLIDIAVPIYSLFTGVYPWHMNPLTFFAFYTPLLLHSIAIRIWAQKWLIERQERGFHILGGILKTGSWWVYAVGFIYTILNIKVPYIPTPKEHDSKNEFLLALPNLCIALLCVVAAVYGLHMDWQPYSFLMAGFAVSNAVILFMAFAIGQTSWYAWIESKFNLFRLPQFFLQRSLPVLNANKMVLRFAMICPISLCFIVLPSYFVDNSPSLTPDSDFAATKNERKIGGFYTGIYVPPAEGQNIAAINKAAEEESKHSFSIISTYLPWSASSVPASEWKEIVAHGAIPMISWEPRTNLFPEYACHSDLSQNKKVFHYITEGFFNNYIDSVAINIRALGHPVFLRFAHEMDNPHQPWSTTGENTPEEFIAAWRYIYNRFESMGIQNVTWVWNPLKASAFDNYFPSGSHYPDNKYVDWIGITCLNYGDTGPDQKWLSFRELYAPFQKKIQHSSINLPVMLAEFGSTSYGGSATEWLKDAMESIYKDYPEIKSLVFFHHNQDQNLTTDWRSEAEHTAIDWTHSFASLLSALDKFDVQPIKSFQNIKAAPAPAHANASIKGSNGNFSMMVAGKPFYLKGICYNPGHDWRDGFLPLTRKQLENDFSQIKAMGANTIRRYEPSIYDKNILSVAEAQGLFVMYGFWFDPSIDYYSNTAAVANYEAKVLKYVEEHKDQKAIIAWNIGNETWGLQKKHFAKPYLTLTRRAYLEFLERLAQKIHALDPDRPVFASEEHEHYQLASTIYEMSTHLPSADVIGINSYFKSNIESLHQTFLQFDTLRPYAVTEFGPKGYWSHEFGDFRNGTLLLELSSSSKADWYEDQWQNYIASNSSANLGGFAFSWRDRYEGTATWFGITDQKGRRKPAYYSLQRAWTGESSIQEQFAEIIIVGPWDTKKPNETLWLSAGILNDYTGSLTYEWEVQDEATWSKVSSIQQSIVNNSYVEVKVPQKKSRYRVYLHAVDAKGNVVTASRPLVVE